MNQKNPTLIKSTFLHGENLTLDICCEVALFESAIQSLKEIFQSSPELVERFLNSLNTASQLCCIDVDNSFAVLTNDLRIVLQPSELFRNFLLTGLAGNIDRMAIKV